MLMMFQHAYTFNAITVRVLTDVAHRETSFTILKTGRILHMGTVPFNETDTPAKVDAYFRSLGSSPNRDYASRIEQIEAQYRNAA